MSALNFPANPQAGDTWTQNGKTFIFNGISWAASTVFTGAEASASPPAEPLENQLWWSSTEGSLRIYYVDSDGTAQWVDTSGGSNILDIPVYDQSLNTTDNVRFANVTTSNVLSSNALTLSSGQFDWTLTTNPVTTEAAILMPGDTTIETIDGHTALFSIGGGTGPEMAYANTDSYANVFNSGVMYNSVYVNETGLFIDLDLNSVAGYKGWAFTNIGEFVFPDNTIQTTAYNRTDKFESKSAATGVVTHNCSNVSVFYHTSISANFTINITNLPVSVNSAAAVTLVLSQGATAYVCNAVQIGAVSQAVLWQGSTSAPTGNANKTDLMTFSIMRTGASSYIVFGQLVSFG